MNFLLGRFSGVDMLLLIEFEPFVGQGKKVSLDHPLKRKASVASLVILGEDFLRSYSSLEVSLPVVSWDQAADTVQSRVVLLAYSRRLQGVRMLELLGSCVLAVFYMKTGQCKFGERCRFHHPIDQSAPNAPLPQVQPNVKLTLAGLPRREGSVACAFYMKTGTCKFGVACKFDHPPPGEAVAMATAQGTGVMEAEAEE